MNKKFVEMVIEGPVEFARGYIRGFVNARGERAEVIFSDEIGMVDDDLVDKIKQALHVKKHVTHMLVDADSAVLVEEAIISEKAENLTLRSKRGVARAEFEYKIAIFNRDLGAQVVKIFEDLPTDVVLEKHELKVKEDPDAKGAELYTPTHDYELTGKGKVSGPVNKIIWLHKELASFEQIETEKINLIFA